MKSEEVKTGPICRGRHCKGLKDLRIGTWNVLSSYQAGALKKLLSQLDSYKTDITALQEIMDMRRNNRKKEPYHLLQLRQETSHVWNRLYSKQED